MQDFLYLWMSLKWGICNINFYNQHHKVRIILGTLSEHGREPQQQIHKLSLQNPGLECRWERVDTIQSFE